MVWKGTHLSIKGLTADNAYQSENQAMRSKELPAELRDRIVSRHRSGGGYKTISAALKVPKSTVASIILKWKKFGTTRTIPRAGHPAKLSNWWRRALSRMVTKNLMVTLVELHDHICRLRNLQKDKHHCNTVVCCGGVAKLNPLLSEDHMKTHLEFAKQHLKDPSDSEKQDSPGLMNLNSKHHVFKETSSAYHLQSTIPKVKCAGSSLVLWGLRDTSELNKSSMHQNIEIALMKPQSRAFRTSDWAEGSPSNMTMTLSTQPRQHRSGLGTTLWMS